jgi:S-formylglutathione hydrolase FrmB
MLLATGTAAAEDTPSPVCTPRSTPIPTAPATQLEDVAVAGTGGRLHRFALQSPALNGRTYVNVLLPGGYDASAAARYPVLYLLHGAIGGYGDWHAAGNVIGIVDEAVHAGKAPPFIVVMPDAGAFGFYTDWYGSDIDGHTPSPPPAWTRYHVGELIPWVDATFATQAAREGRAVAGLSMGGFGAMSYAARFPELFSAAGSFSGAVHPDLGHPFGNAFLTGASLYFDSGKLDQCVWGDMLTQQVRWLGHDPAYLAENLAGTALFVAAGGPVGDPVEQTIYLMSQAFVDALDAEGIAHDDDFYGVGTHTWSYWQDDLRTFLPKMAAAWATPRPAPPQRAFSFRSILPRFSAWGWRFTAHRESTEFTYLDDVGPDGLKVAGSGRLRVVSPPLYVPGAAYRVGQGAGVRELSADSAGRLRFTVGLGRAHRRQQLRFDAAALEKWKHVIVTIQAKEPA